MPWRPPSATCPCRQADGASGSPPASRAGGGGRRARPSAARQPAAALGRGIGGDGLLDLLLGLPGFLVALLLTLGHVRLLCAVRTPYVIPAQAGIHAESEWIPAFA